MQAPKPRTEKPIGFVLLIVVAAVWVASCGRATPTPTPTTVSTEPATPAPLQAIEVTRVVERVVTATPAPAPPACVRGNLADAREVVIGALVPLSRPGAILTGFAMQAALSIAVDDLNMAGGIAGKPVRLVTYDTANSPELGALYAERLITLDCAAVLVGVHHLQVGMAVKEVAHRLQTPLIISAVMADELTADRYPEVFRISPTWTMLAQAPAQWLAEVGDYNGDDDRFVVMVTDNASDSLTHAERVSGWLGAAGFVVESLTVDLPANDFSPVIARIVAMEHVPDAIFLGIPGDTVFRLQQQMLAAGVGPQQRTLLITNSSALHDAAFWAQAPDGVFTVMSRIGPWPSTTSALGLQFAEKYRGYFDRWPDMHSFAAYDAVRLAADSIERAGSLAPDAIIAALEESDVVLAAGRYRFPYGSTNPPDDPALPAHVWHQWLDAPMLYLQYTEPGQSAMAAPVIWPPSLRTVDAPVLSRPAERR